MAVFFPVGALPGVTTLSHQEDPPREVGDSSPSRTLRTCMQDRLRPRLRLDTGTCPSKARKNKARPGLRPARALGPQLERTHA